MSAITLNDGVGAKGAYTIAKGSAGSLTLNGSSAAINVSGGTSNLISAPLVLATSTSADISSGASLGVSGNISGGGGLTLTGPGTLILSGNNDYAVETSVEDGTLVVDTTTALPGKTNLTIGAGGRFVFDPTILASPANPSQQGMAGVGAVPEPGTLALLLAGLFVGLAAWWRRNGAWFNRR